MTTLKTRVKQLEARTGGGGAFDPERWKREAERRRALSPGERRSLREQDLQDRLRECATEEEREEARRWHAIAERQLAQIEALEEPPNE